jgi:hypothetical protein
VRVGWTGSFLVPKWACMLVGGGAAICARSGDGGETAIEQLGAFNRAAERRLLHLQASQLSAQALVPVFACLSCALAPEKVAPSCEKALFSTPEATAVAIFYVAAQISLLGAAKNATSETRPLEC